MSSTKRRMGKGRASKHCAKHLQPRRPFAELFTRALTAVSVLRGLLSQGKTLAHGN